MTVGPAGDVERTMLVMRRGVTPSFATAMSLTEPVGPVVMVVAIFFLLFFNK